VARRTLIAFFAGVCMLTACASLPTASTTGQHVGEAPTTTAAPTTAAPTPSTVAAPAPTTTLPVAGPPIEDVIDVGDAKPERFYDAYLSAALNDIQTWWSQQFPLLFGDAYVPLEGGIYAAYPERTTPIPGCSGTAQNSTYQDVVDAGAFYCPNGDFMAYDDGEDGVIFELAEAYGPSIVAVVMAHEFGHAIQARVGTLNQDVATVYTEQQADCYSGAWSRRAWNGEATGVPFTDGDIELGMIALVEVRDPVGTDVLEPGGHGSAFDRIGAFQEGFYYGVGACADLIDHPLPLQENEFDPAFDDALTNGNAPFGFEEREIFRILNDDLTSWWPAQLAPAGLTMPTIKMTPVTDPATANCGDPQALANSGALFCAATNEVLFDQVYARELYDDFGDFAVGYVIGRAWADAVQSAMGSPLQGEARALASDCLSGAWIGTAQVTDGQGDPNHRMYISPGDLDEAVQTALVLGDDGIHDNVSGSAFERVAHLRLGVLNGLPACYAQIQG
jgi:predicted metalloprotease